LPEIQQNAFVLWFFGVLLFTTSISFLKKAPNSTQMRTTFPLGLWLGAMTYVGCFWSYDCLTVAKSRTISKTFRRVSFSFVERFSVFCFQIQLTSSSTVRLQSREENGASRVLAMLSKVLMDGFRCPRSI